MAVRLELAFAKPSADHWLRLQNAYVLSALRNKKTMLKVQSYELA
jgi:plasmid maintenance system antidote protein VapI